MMNIAKYILAAVFLDPVLTVKAVSPDEVVGKIDDSFTVTPMGQANYEIPIPALPGTGGMTPKLSVTYNSSTKSSILGYGFDLTGLSIITRVPRNMFNDGVCGFINYSSSDRFSLDGSRLIGNSNANIREYSTENRTYSKITAYGPTDNPDSFIVRTKDGLKYEYLPNIKIINPNSVEKSLFWMLTKVIDTKGNYFTVIYSGNNNYNEIYPLRINYTGNDAASLQPYASIRFNYEESPDSAHTYVYGKTVRRSKNIKEIGLYSGENLMKKFSFSYTMIGHKKELVSITEYAADNNHKRPTTFEWHNITSTNLSMTCYNNIEEIYKARLTVGDYNGDGKADVLATPQNSEAGWSGWKLFKSYGNEFVLNAFGSLDSNIEIQQVVSGDFNGDGRDDFVVLGKYNNWYNTYLYLSNGNGFQAAGVKLSLNQKYTIQTVEYNGDGVADLFAWLENSSECRILYSQTNSGNSFMPLTQQVTRYGPVNWDEVEFGDFNGDGLTDIYTANDNGAYVMLCNYYGSFTTNTVNPSKEYTKHFGDFNGDGKTDILITSSGTQQISYWWLFAANGLGGFEPKYYDNNNDIRSKYAYVADVNGDGFDDLITIDLTSTSGGMITPIIWLNDGTGHNFSSRNSSQIYPLDKWNVYIGDFGGNGRADMLCTSKWENGDNWNGLRLYQIEGKQNLLLSKITDGMGYSTEIDYEPMTDGVVHTQDSVYEYPLSRFSAGWPLVFQVKTPDGIGGKTIMVYHYNNAIIHRRGRGVLGFERMTVEDRTTGKKTQTDYRVEPYKYILAPVHTVTSINSRKMTETFTEYNTLCDSGSVFAFHPVSTLENTYEFTSRELVSSSTTSYEYDNHGNITRMESITGDITTLTENTYADNEDKWFLGRMTGSTVTKTGPSGTEVRHAVFAYDPATGLLTGEGTEPGNQTLGYNKVYQRDVFGNIIKSTVTPLGTYSARSEETQYDSKGRYITAHQNSIGHASFNTVNEDNGLLTRSVDANGIVCDYTYDSFGRQTMANISGLSQTTTLMGWSAGNSDAPDNSLYYIRTEATGEPYKIEFCDSLGRTIRTVTENAFGNKVYADIVYNKKGLVEKTSEPYFPGNEILWNENVYDNYCRISTQTTAGGAQTSYSYNKYLTIVTDALGHQITRKTDQYGNLVQSIDHEGNTINYQYDVSGHCTQISGLRTTINMEYDLMGNRTLLDDPDIGQVSSVYNAFGELVSQTDSKGTTTYTYDKLGRVTKEQRPDVTVTNVYDTNFKGELTSSSSSNATSVNYQYDNFGRVVKQTDVIETKTYITQTTYNTQNKVDVITYPSGLTIKHNYSSNGLLRNVKNSSTGAYFWQLTQQDARGNVTKETYGNGLVTTSTYNATTGYLTGIYTSGIQNWTYQYNLAGNLTMRKDNTRNLSETFEYDTLNRLISTRKNGQVIHELTYDNAGNIHSKTGVGNEFTYQEGTNKLTSFASAGYTPKLWNSIQYTSFHKIKYVSQGTKTLTLTYGPNKSRVKSIQTDGSSTTTKYYVSNLYEETYSGSSIRKVNYIFAAGKAVALYETIGNVTAIRYLHHDHLGSIQAYSDEQGSLVQELSYDAWGRRRNPTNWTYYTEISGANAWHDRGFGGHEHLDIFEMVNMDGRMYDPVLGRFLSPDPFVQEPDFTQGLNRYSYCLNNPLSLVDPSGYSWLSNNWKSLVASVVGIAVSALTMGSATPVAVFLAGAAGGAAGALAGALLNGANIGQIAKATFTGAVIGGFTAVLNGAAGDGSFIEQLFKHTFSQGWLEGIQGGNMIHGFMMGAVSGAGGHLIHNNLKSLGKVGEISTSAILSGTVSELGGGKFANGAITGAFSIMFNDMMHVKSYILRMIKKQIEKDGELVFSEAYLWYKIGGGEEITVDASKIDLNFIDPDQYEAGKEYDVQTWRSGIKQGIVYGGLTIYYKGNNYATIKNDKYDFDMHSWDSFKEIIRNVETIGADFIHSKGTPFTIRFKGVNKIKHIYNKIKNWIL